MVSCRKVNAFMRKLCPAIEKADEESDILEDYEHVPFWTARLRSRRARFGRYSETSAMAQPDFTLSRAV